MTEKFLVMLKKLYPNIKRFFKFLETKYNQLNDISFPNTPKKEQI